MGLSLTREGKRFLLLLGIVRRMSPQESDASTAMLRRLSERAEVWVGLPPDHPDHSAVETVRYFDRFEDLDLANARATVAVLIVRVIAFLAVVDEAIAAERFLC